METYIQKYMAFVKTAEYGSFTKAAEILHYSQSGISRMINDLEKGAKAEIATLFEKSNLVPNVRFTTWDDYAVMSMVESGLGASILPELILKRIPYRICVKELDVPAFMNIGFVMRDRRTVSLAVRKFIEFLRFR